MKCAVWSMQYEIWTMKCEVWTVKYEFLYEQWSVNYDVWNINSEVGHIKCELVKSDFWTVKHEQKLRCINYGVWCFRNVKFTECEVWTVNYQVATMKY